MGELESRKSRLIMEGRFLVDAVSMDDRKRGAELLRAAADIEDVLANTATERPGGPTRADHARSAASCRALAARVTAETTNAPA